jgi:hypothetical protein
VTSSDPWLLTQLTFSAPGLWLLLAVAVTLAWGLLWGLIPLGSKDALGILRFVALPYVGLLVGGLSPRFMGLNGLDWLVSFSLGVGLILVILLALGFARITVAIANPLNYGTPPTTSEPTALAPAISDRARSPLFSTALYQIYRSGAEEFHWVFLRGALWELLLATPTPPTLPIYWAIWGAALLALPDILLTGQAPLYKLLKVVVLITTSILFLYTRNFWLCWMLHAAGWAILTSGLGAQIRNTVALPPPINTPQRRG